MVINDLIVRKMLEFQLQKSFQIAGENKIRENLKLVELLKVDTIKRENSWVVRNFVTLLIKINYSPERNI